MLYRSIPSFQIPPVVRSVPKKKFGCDRFLNLNLTLFDFMRLSLSRFYLDKLVKPSYIITRMISTESQWGNWPAKRVRSTYLDYFKLNQHTFIPSSSTIPYEDPTLLFANAG